MTPYPIRKWTALLAVVSLSVLSLAPGAAAAEPPRLTAAEVKAKADKGEVVIVDVRTKEAYDQEHAAGAISIPVPEIEARLAELPKNKLIAAYCT